MTRRLLFCVGTQALILGMVMLNGCAQPKKNVQPQYELKNQIDQIFHQSLFQCEQFNPGCRKCIEDQFHANYQVYVLKPAWTAARGVPGIPGSMTYCSDTSPSPSVELVGRDSSATVFVYFNSHGNLTFGHNTSLDVKCSRCVVEKGITGFPEFSFPLAKEGLLIGSTQIVQLKKGDYATMEMTRSSGTPEKSGSYCVCEQGPQIFERMNKK